MDEAVPEWSALLDALLTLPGLGGRVGYAGGVIAVGVRSAVVEPRLSAALPFAGSVAPRRTFDAGNRFLLRHLVRGRPDPGFDRWRNATGRGEVPPSCGPAW